MRNRILTLFAAAAMMAAAAAPALYAQAGTRMLANIPFDFVVGEKTLPAGQYLVKIGVGSTPSAISIDSTSGHFVAVLTGPVRAGKVLDKGSLVFNHYGEHYFLSQVWTRQSSEGYRLPQTRRERELMKNAGMPPATTTIAEVR